MWQWFDDLDKVGREKAMDSTHLPVVPVLVHLPAQNDDVTFAELEVSWFLAIIVVECLCAGELRYTLEIESKMRKGLKKRHLQDTPCRVGLNFSLSLVVASSCRFSFY